MEHRGDRVAAGLADPVGHGVDGRAAVPHLVDDEDALAAQERVGRELEERRLRTGRARLVVVLDGGDEDVAEPESVGEHPGRDHAAAGDREHDVEPLAGEPVGEDADEPVELVPADDVALRRRHGSHRAQGYDSGHAASARPLTEFLAAVAIAAGAVFVAEFGDKSQLLILAFATRYPAVPVIVGLVIGVAVITGLSVLVGAAVGAILPTELVAIVAGISFIGVGLWTLRGDDDEEDPESDAAKAGRKVGLGLVLTVATTFILGELGDKTMLVTFGLAASQGPLPTWIGATIGEVAANLLAVAVGRGVGSRLDPRTVRIVSAGLFIIGGIAVLAATLLGGD